MHTGRLQGSSCPRAGAVASRISSTGGSAQGSQCALRPSHPYEILRSVNGGQLIGLGNDARAYEAPRVQGQDQGCG